jgi:hypothetical protein
LIYYHIPEQQNIDVEPVPVSVHQDTNQDQLRNRCGHSVWTQKLITPLVHAKAQHLLPTVYHGRLGEENQPYSSGYGNNGGLGKVEIVDEQDMDYEHFKVTPPYPDKSDKLESRGL